MPSLVFWASVSANVVIKAPIHYTPICHCEAGPNQAKAISDCFDKFWRPRNDGVYNGAVKFPKTAFQTALLDWYASTARDLPWRKTKNPYAIWISEMMLQQTQVATVIPYYERWMKRFPSVKALATAAEEEVLKFWAGLGYYRRAHSLHKAAKMIVENYRGQLPTEPSELLKLPGIGRYSAGAIASIAFNKKTPVLDGNVIRVLTRLLALRNDIGEIKTIRRLWEIAGDLVPEKKPGDFNQALMELGAMICLPDRPQCGVCPVSLFCTARKKNTAHRFPVKKIKGLSEKIETAALVLRRNGHVLIQKQPRVARWGGLWMFPFARNKKSIASRFTLDIKHLKPRLTVHHGFTKYRVKLTVYESRHCETVPKHVEAISSKSPGRSRRNGDIVTFRWTKISDLDKLAFPSPHQKIVKDLHRG